MACSLAGWDTVKAHRSPSAHAGLSRSLPETLPRKCHNKAQRGRWHPACPGHQPGVLGLYQLAALILLPHMTWRQDGQEACWQNGGVCEKHAPGGEVLSERTEGREKLCGFPLNLAVQPNPVWGGRCGAECQRGSAVGMPVGRCTQL